MEEEAEGFTAGQAARLLGRAEAGWGRATYGLALGRLHKSYESRAADQDGSDEDRADARVKAEQTHFIANPKESWIARSWSPRREYARLNQQKPSALIPDRSLEWHDDVNEISPAT